MSTSMSAPPRQESVVEHRIIYLSLVAISIAVVSALLAQLLIRLINLITNVAFYSHWASGFVSPTHNQRGPWVMLIPVIGGVIVGLMARYGSKGIRGHGIPEAMEQVLVNESRIPPRLTFLKPLSAAIAMGTGGPFGAEGPIIATGGAFGSLVGQLLKTTADERKTLLAAGAAAGMSAIFGSPVAAVLLAIELLLFEFNPQSFVPIALASAVAAAVRIMFVGFQPIFDIPRLAPSPGSALFFYVVLGAVVGLASVYVTKTVYLVEDLFERVPVHWMWWPALGAVVVGVIGYGVPATLGVGYDNIEHILSGQILGRALVLLFVFKFISWSVSLGSGTSGGTLAPLFTIGGGLGAALGGVLGHVFPHAGIDPRTAALVGMASMFAGASQILLASVVLAFETTMQPLGLLPLLGGCTAAYLVSSLLMEYTIMTEKITRRGTKVPTEFAPDFLALRLVNSVMTQTVVTLPGRSTVEEARRWLAGSDSPSQHQGFPVVDELNQLLGIITRRDVLDPHLNPTRWLSEILKRPPIVIYEDNTLREAADLMVEEEIGRLPVVRRSNPLKVIGILTRSDLLKAHRPRLKGIRVREQIISLPFLLWQRSPSKGDKPT